ncbi:MAG: mannitol dehydrogenase family protein [Proteobacteria bacterium]|nr:mannitol dehydrogenase family protein [Pseudomonadota bacterium]
MAPEKTIDQERRLGDRMLSECGDNVAVPGYVRAERGFGIVHLGLGAFHRAHQAEYTDSAMSEFGGDWKIVGVSLRNPDVRDRLNPQDGLYTIAEMGDSVTNYRIIGSIERVLVAPEDPAAVLEALCSADCRIVSLTITEKGYCHDPATGRLNVEHPDIRRDLAQPSSPATALGFIVESLALRRREGLPVPTVLCCDNLPSNGDTLRNLVVEFAGLRDAGLAAWIREAVPFPNSMVDRIVPATQPEDIEQLRKVCAYVDNGMVKAELFSQWVIEDRFARGRPRWESVGVDMVEDVEPFEIAKLRLLNGAHSALAYMGYLAGYQFAHEAIADDQISRFVENLMHEEIIPTLHEPDGLDLHEYANSLIDRFANPALRHRLYQIAMDGSQKLSQRWLGTLRDRLRAGETVELLALSLAAWIRYVAGFDENGAPIDVQDPLAAEFREILKRCTEDGLVDAERLVEEMVSIDAVFGADLKDNGALKSGVVFWLSQLLGNGVLTTLKLREAIPA